MLKNQTKTGLRTLCFSSFILLCISVSAFAQRPYISGKNQVTCGTSTAYSFKNCDDYFTEWIVVFPNGNISVGNGTLISILWNGGPGVATISVNGCQIFETMQVNVAGVQLAKPSLGTIEPLCNGASANITASAVSGADTYTFQVPAGWKLNDISRTALTTSSRTVKITAPNSGNGTASIKVKANSYNPCNLSSVFRSRSVKYGADITLSGRDRVDILREEFYVVKGNNLSDIRWKVTRGEILNDPRLPESTIAVIFDRQCCPSVEVSAKSCGQPFTKKKWIEVAIDGPPIYRKNTVAELPDNTSEIKLYPTLVQNTLTIEVPELEGAQEIKITNLMQQTVMTKVLEQNKETLDLSTLDNGIYFLIYNNGKKPVVKRFQVTH